MVERETKWRNEGIRRDDRECTELQDTRDQACPWTHLVHVLVADGIANVKARVGFIILAISDLCASWEYSLHANTIFN